MTIQQAYQQLLSELYNMYDTREAANIADLTIEKITGFQKIDRILNKGFLLNNEQQKQLNDFSQQLIQHIPIQYVLREAWFCGVKFYVDENVLIPRPETEELVEWVLEEAKGLKLENNVSILDVGTGSGCIPVSLKRRLLKANISAIDIDEGALNVAKKNAAKQDVLIDFLQLDFLNEEEWPKLKTFDIIVSNPPYIKQSEEGLMHKNVLEHEPHIALFVPDNDALIFYRKIALFAMNHLEENGIIFLEINEALGDEVKELFTDFGYHSIKIKKDLQGKDRMIKVLK